MINLFKDIAFAPAMEARPLICLDVGARGGFERDLEPIAFAVDAHGFEPDPVAFADISGESGPWRSLTHHPLALSGLGGTRILHIPTDPVGASLLEHNPEIGRIFDKPQFFTRDKTVTVETETLDRAVEILGVPRVDYLKLDIEGAELEVLRSGPKAVAHLLALKVEVSFVPSRMDQPLACDVDRALLDEGFVLMDMLGPAHWRRQGYVIHPLLDDGPIPYSKGQLIQGDYLFFRDPATITEPEQAIRAAFLAMAHGYFDHAARLLARSDVAADLQMPDLQMPDLEMDVTQALGEASRRMGKVQRKAAFRHQLRGLVRFLKF